MTLAGTTLEKPVITLKAAIEEARIHWRAGRIESAGRAYDLVASLDPKADKASEIARFRTRAGDLVGARDVLLAAIQTGSRRTAELLMLAEAEWALGDRQSARARFHAYLPGLSLDPEALTVLFRLPEELKDPDPVPLVSRALSEAGAFQQAHGLQVFHALRRARLLSMAEEVLCKTASVADRQQITALGISLPMHSAKLQLARDQKDVVATTYLMENMVPPADILAQFGDGSLDWRKRAAAANRLPVPRIIHQVWIGALPVPATTGVWRAYCAKQGYEYRLWREADLETIGVLAMPAFQSQLSRRRYPAAVDIARYVILAQCGGIYLDCDFLPCSDENALHDILPMVGYAALSEQTYRKVAPLRAFITNGFLATPPGHPVFTTAVQGLEAALALVPYATAWWVPGPVYLTAVSKGTLTVIDPTIVASGWQAKTLEEALMMAHASARTGAALLAWKPW